MEVSDAVPYVRESNYIKRLEMQVRLMADEIVARENARLRLLDYVSSSKFRTGNHLVGYVHVEDIILRLRR